MAEGVETEADMAELLRLGCDRAQGFLMAATDTAEAVGSRLFGSVLRESA